MQMENSAQIYFNKENAATGQKAKAGGKGVKREFGRELHNVERTPVAAEHTSVDNQHPALWSAPRPIINSRLSAQ